MAFDLMDFRGVGAGVTKNTIKDFFFFKFLFNVDVTVHME